MRKIAGWVSVIYLCIVSAAWAEKPSHLQELRSRYPFGLIEDDYGLLTVEDLAVNACNAETLTPFISEENGAYPYWQCFPLKDAKVRCQRAGYDPSTKKVLGYTFVEAKNKNGLQSYLARDARDLQLCRDFLRDWKKTTRGESFVCVAGSFGRVQEAKDGHKETDWVFEKYKTRKGCVSDGFACSLREVSDCAHHVSSR
jgi:hypothetical protein